MIVFKEPLDGECRWVFGSVLEQLTREGWHLVAMGEEESAYPYQDQESHQGVPDQYSNCVSPDIVNVTKHRQNRSMSFLVRKGRDEVLDGLRKRVKEAEERRDQAEKQSAEAVKASEVTQATLEKTRANMRGEQATSERLRERLADQQERNHTLEAHLAAVRKEVGEAKWRELTGVRSGAEDVS